MCTGVLPATGKEAYTPARGRLILSNGYCEGGCAEREPQALPQPQVLRQGPPPQEPVRQAPMPRAVRLPG
ncbi:hypothetical protein [Nonomuraea sp. NPDC046570]|uniref:hypothetical protein n=1 Tax=Nonomuraea sp. NPDC046570 TaxID=3155255 RepID=UPI0033CCF7D5